MKQCPTCKRETKDHLFFCPYDGQALVPKVEHDPFLGTVLDGKYRLDERINMFLDIPVHLKWVGETEFG